MNSNDWTIRQKAILALCTLSIILDGFDTQVIGFVAPAILADWAITKADLAPIFGIGLLGMSVGAATGGYLGDRLGRRTGMIASTLVFGLATCAMATAGSVIELAGLRFIAGLGLGGALPIAAALVAEFAPPNRRGLAVSISIVCIPVGGILGGAIAAPLLPELGWRGLFGIAGALPIMVAAVHFVWLPESPSFLAARSVIPSAVHDPVAPNPPATLEANGQEGFFRSLSTLKLRADTFALWGAFASSLLGGYLYFNWLPVLLADAGFGLSTSSVGLLVYNIGCVASGIGVGALTTRTGPRAPLCGLGVLGAASALVLMVAMPTPQQPALLFPALVLQGFCLGGVQVLLYALAVDVFPAPIRATGIGSAASIGRIGAIVSSALGAAVLAWGASGFFATIAIALAICCSCVLLIRSVPFGGSRQTQDGS